MKKSTLNDPVADAYEEVAKLVHEKISGFKNDTEQIEYFLDSVEELIEICTDNNKEFLEQEMMEEKIERAIEAEKQHEYNNSCPELCPECEDATKFNESGICVCMNCSWVYKTC